MGAWGADSFDNDTACDWSFSLREVEDLSLVESTLARVTTSSAELIDADAGCEAIAACEVVARLAGKFGVCNPYTKPVDTWVKAHPQSPSPKLVQTALQAIDRVLGDNSELRQLWDESGETEWLAAVDALRRRLS